VVGKNKNERQGAGIWGEAKSCGKPPLALLMGELSAKLTERAKGYKHIRPHKAKPRHVGGVELTAVNYCRTVSVHPTTH